MRRSTRLSLALAGAAAVAMAPLASAGTSAPNTLVVPDATGDVLAAQTAYDITGVTYTTTGTTETRKVGKKKVAVYTPKDLVVTMNLAAPPSTNPTSLYQVNVETGSCGGLQLYYAPSLVLEGSGGLVSCGSEPDETGSTTTFLDVVPQLKGNSIVFTMSIKGLPKEMKAGSTLSGTTAFTTIVEPVTGIFGPYQVDPAASYDTATSDATFVIG